ncbi:MAG: hypothetical protein ACXVZ1_07465 [Gaiellaceae bacterium]
MLAAGLVVAVAAPVFLSAGWPLAAWLLAAALWVAGAAFTLALRRLRPSEASPVSAGLVGFAMMLRTVAVLVVLGVLAVSNPTLAVPALLVYALAYTCELVLSLVSYFGGEPL